MATRKRLRRILQWVAWAVGIWVYAVIVFVIVGHAFGYFALAVCLFLAPFVVLLAFWVYVEGPAELADKMAVRVKAMLRD